MELRWIRNGQPADPAALSVLDSVSCFVSMGESVSPPVRRALEAHTGDTARFNGIVDPLVVRIAPGK
jgi:hypothetical protein